MAIDGISQSSGVERLLDVRGAATGVLLVIRDRLGDVERTRVVLPAADLLAALTDGTAGRRTLNGTAEGFREPKWLDIEVRGNEVLLRARSRAEEGWDVAVGLDDFQDALEAALTPPTAPSGVG
jgi:hypothetical protein